MKALLRKTNEWVEIDTKCLFHNQYNTTEECGNRRIFDRDIEEIQDDARIGKGVCKYCGKIVEKGKEREHYEQEKNKKCSLLESDKCFWKRKKIISQKYTPLKKETSCTGNTFTEVESVETVTEFSFCCEHNEKYGGCTYEQCEKYGINWFTEENCFFLKYPKGYKSFTIIDFLRFRNWRERSKGLYKYHDRNLGSYELVAEVEDNCIKHFVLSNSRKRIVFTYDELKNNFIIEDSFGNKVSKILLPENENSPKCNEKINKTVISVLRSLYDR